METQTRFNLNAAIQSWQQELAAQSNLTADVRRELETHVRDSVADLQSRSLNDEEAFWLARRRIGNPSELGDEFQTADPVKAHRERVLWIGVAFFALNLWQNLANGLWSILFRPWGWFSVFGFRGIFIYLPFAWLAVSLARGRYVPLDKPWNSLFHTRKRFAVISCLALLVTSTVQVAAVLIANREAAIRFGNPQLAWTGVGFILTNPALLIWPVILIAVIFWLLPTVRMRRGGLWSMH
jgi:hypothetical protein